MKVIYEPKGRAREYAELACNLYMGCMHGCRYCYAPACMRTTADQWRNNVKPRNKIIEYFEKDAVKLRGDKRRILFSFLSDPYQPIERKERLTRQALNIVYKYKLKSQILTKGCFDLIDEDMALILKTNTHLGITLCFSDDEMRKAWEPNASSVDDRINILKKAHNAGIYTWVSLEPVIDPQQALAVVKTAHKYVCFWKIGKLNHMPEDEKKVNWNKFLVDVENILKKYNCKYYIKNDLRALF